MLFNLCLENVIKRTNLNVNDTIINRSLHIKAYVDHVVISRKVTYFTEVSLQCMKQAALMGLQIKEEKSI